MIITKKQIHFQYFVPVFMDEVANFPKIMEDYTSGVNGDLEKPDRRN